MHPFADVRIHPSAEVSNLAVIEAGSQVWNNAQIREHARLGKCCIVGKDVYVDAGVQVGDNVKIQNSALLYHGTTIETGVFIGPGVIFTNDKRPRAITTDGSLKTAADWEVGSIRICKGAAIGAGSIILPDVTVGEFAMIGAGAVVTKNVPAYALMVGNPAKQVGYVCVCGTKLSPIEQLKYQCPVCSIQYDFVEATLDRNLEALHW
jgi:UDP-2-acetamido-3-amino-2,3-dideoxy-glucuronate N-acetyltransferase